MLYLEDYLEMLQHFPDDLKDRFQEMRELDHSVQSRMQSIDDKQKEFFANCKRLPPAEREKEFKKIKAEFQKAMSDSDEKIKHADEAYGLLDRHLRKLDQELLTFKLELEADHRGVTETLEKRSLEMDLPPQKENKDKKKNAASSSSHRKGDNKTINHGGNVPQKKKKANNGGLTLNYPYVEMNNPLTSGPLATGSSNAARMYTLNYINPSSPMGNSPSGGLETNPQLLDVGSNLLGEDGLLGDDASGLALGNGTGLDAAAGIGVGGDDNVGGLGTGAAAGANGGEVDWSDPSEPRYCICNQVSYGEMVACDHQDCEEEWFHYPCVGITAPPKGKWYCPTCRTKRGGRKQ